MTAMDAKGPDGASVRASLIVLNYEGLEVLTSCVETLRTAMGPDDELIVVDNGSTDGSPEWLREQSDVRSVLLPENTYIFGLNEGLAIARGRYVAFLNNDMTVEPGFVERSLACFTASDIFAVCPRILAGNGDEQGSRTAGFWSRGILFYQSLDHSEESTSCFFAVGGQSFFDHAKLLEIGSIDPLLWPMYHEDIELSYRAWKRGWRIVYAPHAVAHHLGGRTSKKVFTPTDLRSFVRQNEFLMVWKNVTDRRLMAAHAAYLPARIAVAAARRDVGTLRGFSAAVRRIPQVRQARRRAKAHFRRSDREVLAVVSRIN